MYPQYTYEQRLKAFWQKVDPCRTDGCAIWLGGKTVRGYGVFWHERKLVLAHHFLIGKAPAGLEWDHHCNRRGCIWPEHLEAVTHQENMTRGVIRRRSV